MSHQADSELPEHIIDLGHQPLSFHHVRSIRKPEFRGLIQPFQAKYPAPEPAPAYPPDWLTDNPTLKAAVNRFVSAALSSKPAVRPTNKSVQAGR